MNTQTNAKVNVVSVAPAEGMFSADFYTRFYQDLRSLSKRAAARHWRDMGQAEGRYPNATAVVRSHAARGDNLPRDFNPTIYLLVNPDLGDTISGDVEAAAHFLTSGRAESRPYKAKDPQFVNEVYLCNDSAYSTSLFQSLLAKATPFFECLDDMLLHRQVVSRKFLELFSVSDYVSSYGHLGLINRSQCLHHFLTIGIEEAAPITLDLWFDVQFYVENNVEVGGLLHQNAYMHWINIGIDRFEAPNASKFLYDIGLFETAAFPAGFDANIYLAANPDLRGSVVGRWRLLQHCVTNGIAEGRPGSQLGPDTLDLHRTAADRFAISGRLDDAKKIYQTVLAVRPTHVMANRHFADCLLRLGDFFNASLVYERSLCAGEGTIWTRLNLSTCYLELKRWHQAAAMIRRAHDEHPGDRGILKRLVDTSRLGFDALYREALWLASQGFHEHAHARATEAVQVLSSLAGPRPSKPRKSTREIRNVVIVADVGLPQCRFYRVDQKVEQLASLGITATVFDYTKSAERICESVAAADAVIFYRVPASVDVVMAISAASAAEIPTFYEIDDLMFDSAYFPDSFESYGGQISVELYATLVIAPALLRGAMALCDYAIASTPTLARAMEAIVVSGEAFVHRNGLHQAHEVASPLRALRPSGDAVQIFYGTGTRAHNEDFDLYVAPALAKLLGAHPKARLIIVGYLTLPSILSSFTSQITLADPIWDLSAYWRLLSAMQINIAVLKPGIIADCKSEIKWLEAAMLGVPSVVTPTITFQEVIENRVTGSFATTAAEWFDALNALINNPHQRDSIRRAAKEKVQQAYSLGAMSKNLQEIFATTTDTTSKRPDRMKVLIVNVFFPPQAIGGATRVVADNVLDFVQFHGDAIEVEVFTAVEGGISPYQMSRYMWNGVPVTAITTPDDPNIDRNAYDADMGTAFVICVDRFRPDVIHFHCIQRLTTAVCEVARSRKIRYVVTLHDGWWMSEAQFLVDEFGSPDLYELQEPLLDFGFQGLRKFDRMSLLAANLDSAGRVCAVSQSFADIYTRYGIKNVRVIENGVPPMPVQPRCTSKTGKVRIGYLGGLSLHKGYHLVKAAFMRSEFHNLELTVIDHSLQPGVERTSTWGTTPVKFRGKYPQDNVADLYSNLDVLLAPSVWPESYGLVVREAIESGCWVVASDRGAIGKDIKPGVGHVVDVGSYYGLKDVLNVIEGNVDLYLGPTECLAPLRRSRQQATELVELYYGLQLHEEMLPETKQAVSKVELAGRGNKLAVRRGIG